MWGGCRWSSLGLYSQRCLWTGGCSFQSGQQPELYCVFCFRDLSERNKDFITSETQKPLKTAKFRSQEEEHSWRGQDNRRGRYVAVTCSFFFSFLKSELWENSQLRCKKLSHHKMTTFVPMLDKIWKALMKMWHWDTFLSTSVMRPAAKAELRRLMHCDLVQALQTTLQFLMY